jgi:carboxylate-amine ligase
VDELRGAAWRAARFGLDDRLVSPVSHELVAAAEAVHQLTDLVAASLEAAGDADLVRRGLEALLTRGTGAARQREVVAAGGSLTDVVADVRRRTVRS